MATEYEATFTNIDPREIRMRLEKSGAKCARAEYAQRRYVLRIPGESSANHVWARVRDEGDKITMSLKSNTGTTIADQKEIEIIVSDFDEAVSLLEGIGCTAVSYQETRRELWMLGDIEITIDTWPFLDPFVEIEGDSEFAVQEAASRLSLPWNEALFGNVNILYRKKFGESVNVSSIPHLTFGMQNPFLPI